MKKRPISTAAVSITLSLLSPVIALAQSAQEAALIQMQVNTISAHGECQQAGYTVEWKLAVSAVASSGISGADIAEGGRLHRFFRKEMDASLKRKMGTGQEPFCAALAQKYPKFVHR